MKNLFISFFYILIGVSNLYSQTYFTGSGLWSVYNISTTDQTINYTTQISLNGDTVIENRIYLKLLDKSGTYIGAIREESNKVYAKLKHLQSYENVDEILMYDFTLKEGERVFSNCPEGPLFQSPEIIKIDTIQLKNGEKRKRFFLTNDTWIEGIGSLGGFLFPTIESLTNYTVQKLVCYKQNNEIMYRDDELCKENCCERLDMNEKKNDIISKLEVSPNPVNSNLNVLIPVEYADNEKTITLVNNLGKNLFKQKTMDNSCEIKMSQFTPGIYFLVVEIDDSLIESSKIIKK